MAVVGGYKAVVKLLVDWDDVKADLKDMDGRTPTNLASYKSNIAVEILAKTSRFAKALSLIESNFKIEPLNRLTYILTPNITTSVNTYFKGRAAC